MMSFEDEVKSIEVSTHVPSMATPSADPELGKLLSHFVEEGLDTGRKKIVNVGFQPAPMPAVAEYTLSMATPKDGHHHIAPRQWALGSRTLPAHVDLRYGLHGSDRYDVIENKFGHVWGIDYSKPTFKVASSDWNQVSLMPEPALAAVDAPTLDKNLIAAADSITYFFPQHDAAKMSLGTGERAQVSKLFRANTNPTVFVWRLAALWWSSVFAEMHGDRLVTNSAARELKYTFVSKASEWRDLLATHTGSNVVAITSVNASIDILAITNVLQLAANPQCPVTLAAHGFLPGICSTWPALPNAEIVVTGSVKPSIGLLTPEITPDIIWDTAVLWCVQNSNVELLVELVNTIAMYMFTHSDKWTGPFGMEHTCIQLPEPRMSGYMVLPFTAQIGKYLREGGYVMQPQYKSILMNAVHATAVCRVAFWQVMMNMRILDPLEMETREAEQVRRQFAVTMGMHPLMPYVQHNLGVMGVDASMGWVMLHSQFGVMTKTRASKLSHMSHSALQWADVLPATKTIPPNAGVLAYMRPLGIKTEQVSFDRRMHVASVSAGATHAQAIHSLASIPGCTLYYEKTDRRIIAAEYVRINVGTGTTTSFPDWIDFSALSYGSLMIRPAFYLADARAYYAAMQALAVRRSMQWHILLEQEVGELDLSVFMLDSTAPDMPRDGGRSSSHGKPVAPRTNPEARTDVAPDDYPFSFGMSGARGPSTSFEGSDARDSAIAGLERADRPSAVDRSLGMPIHGSTIVPEGDASRAAHGDREELLMGEGAPRVDIDDAGFVDINMLDGRRPEVVTPPAEDSKVDADGIAALAEADDGGVPAVDELKAGVAATLFKPARDMEAARKLYAENSHALDAMARGTCEALLNGQNTAALVSNWMRHKFAAARTDSDSVQLRGVSLSAAAQAAAALEWGKDLLALEPRKRVAYVASAMRIIKDVSLAAVGSTSVVDSQVHSMMVNYARLDNVCIAMKSNTALTADEYFNAANNPAATRLRHLNESAEEWDKQFDQLVNGRAQMTREAAAGYLAARGIYRPRKDTIQQAKEEYRRLVDGLADAPILYWLSKGGRIDALMQDKRIAASVDDALAGGVGTSNMPTPEWMDPEIALSAHLLWQDESVSMDYWFTQLGGTDRLSQWPSVLLSSACKAYVARHTTLSDLRPMQKLYAAACEKAVVDSVLVALHKKIEQHISGGADTDESWEDEFDATNARRIEAKEAAPEVPATDEVTQTSLFGVKYGWDEDVLGSGKDDAPLARFKALMGKVDARALRPHALHAAARPFDVVLSAAVDIAEGEFFPHYPKSKFLNQHGWLTDRNIRLDKLPPLHRWTLSENPEFKGTDGARRLQLLMAAAGQISGIGLAEDGTIHTSRLRAIAAGALLNDGRASNEPLLRQGTRELLFSDLVDMQTSHILVVDSEGMPITDNLTDELRRVLAYVHPSGAVDEGIIGTPLHRDFNMAVQRQQAGRGGPSTPLHPDQWVKPSRKNAASKRAAAGAPSRGAPVFTLPPDTVRSNSRSPFEGMASTPDSGMSAQAKPVSLKPEQITGAVLKGPTGVPLPVSRAMDAGGTFAAQAVKNFAESKKLTSATTPSAAKSTADTAGELKSAAESSFRDQSSSGASSEPMQPSSPQSATTTSAAPSAGVDFSAI